MLNRTLWENAEYACPIVGTCLSTAELRKLAQRVGLMLPEAASDYELHGCFVSLAKRPERPARMIQKHLDKKFHRQLKRFSKAKTDEEIWTLWVEMADAGDIPGAFWSVMRHRGASERLAAQVYGEVHMLSHLVGASTRADLRRLAETQAQVERLAATLAERKTVLREAVAVWKRRTGELERELAAERARREQAERERLSLRQMVETRAMAELEADRDALLCQLRDITDRLHQAEATGRRQAAIIEDNYREESALRAQLSSQEHELRAMELALAQSLGADMAVAAGVVESCDADCSGPSCGAGCADTENCPCPRLRGKRVLYVGGRSGLKGQYRALGERFGCEVLHHDGGLEQSPQHLHQLLSRADAVVCPVDCVSHEACAAVKRLCRTGGKPVLFARSSGLSSLASSLTELDRAGLDRSCQ